MDNMARTISRAPFLRSARAAATRWVRHGDSVLASPRTWALSIVAIAVLQAVLIFTHRPWLDEVQALQLASEFMLFEFLTLSRSMTLGVAFVIVATATWRTRWVWLAIAMLPFCDFLFGALSGVMVVLKLRDRDLFWPGLIAWVISGVAAAWTVLPADDMLPALQNAGFFSDLLIYLANLGTLAVPFQGGILPVWNRPTFPLAGVLWIPFLIVCWNATRGDHFHRVLLFGFISLTLVFSLFVYPLAIRHMMLIALLLLVFVWLWRTRGGRPEPGFRLWIAIASACGILTAGINLAIPFDTAPSAAAKIRAMGLADKHWQVWPDSRAQVVSALTGIDFERTERHCMQSAIRWDYQTTLRTPQRLEQYLANEIEQHGRHYLLSDIDVSVLNPTIVRKIAVVPAGYNGQAYYLYVVGPTAAEQPVDLPPCVTGQRPLERLKSRI